MPSQTISMPQHPGPQLAIVIPTYRWNDLARETLTQAAAIGSDDIVVHIGDNSADPEKHAFLAALAARSTNVAVTCHPSNLGADPNWLFLIKAQTTPYICMAADDDSFTGAYYRSALAMLRGDPTCATAAGLHISVAQSGESTKGGEGDKGGGRPVLGTPVERLEADPLERIRNYRGENTICYAVSRRTVIAGFARLVESNPLPCPFYDYMLAFHLLSTGTYRLDRNGFVYLYDHTNWQRNDAFIESNKRWYKGYTLPESFGYLTRLHWAVVAAHFFSSTYRSPDLSAEHADAIVAYLFQRQRTEFIGDYHLYRSTIEALFAGQPEAAAALDRLMTRSYKRLTPIFDDFARVVAVFAPETAARYRAFQAETLLPRADAIRLSPFAPFASMATARVAIGCLLRRRSG